jgi:hypothetical protein
LKQIEMSAKTTFLDEKTVGGILLLGWLFATGKTK